MGGFHIMEFVLHFKNWSSKTPFSVARVSLARTPREKEREREASPSPWSKGIYFILCLHSGSWSYYADIMLDDKSICLGNFRREICPENWLELALEKAKLGLQQTGVLSKWVPSGQGVFHAVRCAAFAASPRTVLNKEDPAIGSCIDWQISDCIPLSVARLIFPTLVQPL